jgi:hypothetical protein
MDKEIAADIIRHDMTTAEDILHQQVALFLDADEEEIATEKAKESSDKTAVLEAEKTAASSAAPASPARAAPLPKLRTGRVAVAYEQSRLVALEDGSWPQPWPRVHQLARAPSTYPASDGPRADATRDRDSPRAHGSGVKRVRTSEEETAADTTYPNKKYNI